MLEAAAGTPGADKRDLFDMTDFVIDACRFPPETGHRAKHVASPPVVVAARKLLLLLPLPPSLPVSGGVIVSLDTSWVANNTTR